MIEEPIACTLTPGDFKSRIASIAALNRAALLDDKRDDLRLVLTYTMEERDRVLAMIEAERTCCAFLDFAVEESAETLTVTIVAPEAAREAAETVFEPFRSKSWEQHGAPSECVCCPEQIAGDEKPAATDSGIANDKTTNRLVGAPAALAATGALACGICCVLPFALPAAVVAVTGGTMAWFAGMHGLITLLAGLAVFLAWGWVAYQSYRSKKRPARSTVFVMGFATVVLLAAFSWPRLEPLAFRLIGK